MGGFMTAGRAVRLSAKRSEGPEDLLARLDRERDVVDAKALVRRVDVPPEDRSP